MNLSLPLERFDSSFYEWPSFETTPHAATPPKDSAKKQKQALKCLHAIDELVQTERDYVHHLSHLVKTCFAQGLHDESWITDAHKHVLMRNAKDLLLFHKRLLVALDELYLNNEIHARCSHIANTFLEMGSGFTLYDSYCDKHDAAIEVCNEYRHKPEWTAFTRECTLPFYMDALDPAAKPLRFEDYLIKPVQRICRYQLLLKEILRYTAKDTAEHRRLDCALGMMQAIVSGIDRRKYHRDNSERTRLFLDRLDVQDGRLAKDVLMQLGNLIIAGPLDVAYSSLGHMSSSPPRPKYLGCFVFDTYLLLVRPKKVTAYVPKYWFPLGNVELDDLPDVNDQANHGFVLRFKKHCFVFTATCQREKKLWLEKLTHAIEHAKLQPADAPCSQLTSSFSISAAAPLCSESRQHVTKIHASRSLTNLLDFTRDASISTSAKHAPVPPLPSGSPVMSIHRSKSYSVQRRPSSSTFDATSCSLSSSPPPPMPPLPASPTTSQGSEESTTPPLTECSTTPTTRSSTITTVKSTMTMTIATDSEPHLTSPPLKRHSVDFSPQKMKKESTKARIHSEMYVKPPPLLADASNGPSALNSSSNNGQLSSSRQHRAGSMDVLPSSASQMSISMLSKIKSNHQQALRVGYDHKLRDVCTQDYLSSRSWSVLLRESSVSSGTPNSTVTATTTATGASSSSFSASSLEKGMETAENTQQRRKSSLSNLRSSASSFSLFITNSARRVSDGSFGGNANRAISVHHAASLQPIHAPPPQQDALTRLPSSSLLNSSVSTLNPSVASGQSPWYDMPLHPCAEHPRHAPLNQPQYHHHHHHYQYGHHFQHHHHHHHHHQHHQHHHALASSVSSYDMPASQAKSKSPWLRWSTTSTLAPPPTHFHEMGGDAIKKKRSHRLLAWMRPQDKDAMPYNTPLSSFVQRKASSPASLWHRPRSWFTGRRQGCN
ncbi:hypothetical protein BC940DRAFT_343456 [Gongronella butleri]|nr:hypothetical protein BC940DRAFT_343456 [Gongronella butleri]